MPSHKGADTMTTIIINYAKESDKKPILKAIERDGLACIRYDSLNRVTILLALNKGKEKLINALVYEIKATVFLVEIKTLS